MLWEYLVLALLVVFTGAYGLGRRQGRAAGFEAGQRFAPLELRRQSWETGYCRVCGSRPLPESEPGQEQR